MDFMNEVRSEVTQRKLEKLAHHLDLLRKNGGAYEPVLDHAGLLGRASGILR